MARDVQSYLFMKHSLLMVLGAGVVALDYLVFRAMRLSGADMNLQISMREQPPSC